MTNVPSLEPTSPGQILSDHLKRLGWTQGDLAERLNISQQHISDLVNDRKDISVEMSLKLERAGLGEAAQWLQAQTEWKLWHRRRRLQAS